MENLLVEGPVILPELEKALEKCHEQVIRERIEDIMLRVRFGSARSALLKWTGTGAKDIITGSWLVARHQYFDLTRKEIEEQINCISRDVWIELNHNLTAIEKVKILNHIIFKEHHFSGDSSDFFNPQNSYINKVLSNRKGNPVTLGIIYMGIARKLDIPVFGVNLPRNFLLAYRAEPDEISEDKYFTRDVLFYINPFQSGALLGRKEIDIFLDKQEIPHDPSYYAPCSNQQIIHRLITNLIFSYKRLQNREKTEQFQMLLSQMKKKGEKG